MTLKQYLHFLAGSRLSNQYLGKLLVLSGRIAKVRTDKDYVGIIEELYIAFIRTF